MSSDVHIQMFWWRFDYYIANNLNLDFSHSDTYVYLSTCTTIVHVHTHILVHELALSVKIIFICYIILNTVN